MCLTNTEDCVLQYLHPPVRFWICPSSSRTTTISTTSINPPTSSVLHPPPQSSTTPRITSTWSFFASSPRQPVRLDHQRPVKIPRPLNDLFHPHQNLHRTSTSTVWTTRTTWVQLVFLHQHLLVLMVEVQVLKLVCNLDQVESEFVEVSVLVLVYVDTHLQLFLFQTNQRRMDMFLFATGVQGDKSSFG